MKCKIINAVMFAAGAAIGYAVTWKVLKTKYDRIIQEEIDSVKEAFSDRIDDFQNSIDDGNEDEEEESQCSPNQINWDELEDLDEEEVDFTEDDRIEYEEIASNYTSEKGGAEDMNSTAKPPYVISPFDFGELDDYEQIELTYYADGILEDEDYHIVTDVEELIGRDSLTTFGEYEDDSVFVRNERLSTDFQILKDYRTYEEARSVGPNKVDD